MALLNPFLEEQAVRAFLQCGFENPCVEVGEELLVAGLGVEPHGEVGDGEQVIAAAEVHADKHVPVLAPLAIGDAAVNL